MGNNNLWQVAKLAGEVTAKWKAQVQTPNPKS